MAAKKVENVINGLREDVERWKLQMAALQEGDGELARKISGWIAEAEKVLAKWDEPRAVNSGR
jgi:hypothetical protein